MCVPPSSAPCCPSPTPVVRQSIFLSLDYGARCINSFSPVHLDSFFLRLAKNSEYLWYNTLILYSFVYINSALALSFI